MSIKISVKTIIAFLTGLSFLLLLSILSYQIQFWLQHGSWVPFPLYKLIYYFDIDLYFVLNIKPDGIREIIISILELPVSVILFILIIIGCYLYILRSN